MFVRNPVPSKKEWDAVQGIHPKALLCSIPCLRGNSVVAMSAADTDAFGSLVTDICYAGTRGDPVYLHIEKFHRAKLAEHVGRGGEPEKFRCRIIKRLLDKIVMPANWLMFRLDPDGTKPIAEVHEALKPYWRDFQTFLLQHEDRAKGTVDQ